MNYIKQLQAENLELKNNLKETESKITDVMIYLCSDKFNGPKNNFVNATEMFNWLREIRTSIFL